MRPNSRRESYAELLQEFLCSEISCDILIGLIEVRAADIRPLLQPQGGIGGRDGQTEGKDR